MKRHFLLVPGTIAALLMSPLIAAADAPKVVASIKPVHALVAGVMGEVGTPELIIEGAGSPHTYSLKPSQARALQEASVIFYVDPNLETFLDKPLDTLAGDARVVTLSGAEGVTRLPFREGGPFEGHDHEDEHDHEDGHDEHAHKDDHHADHGQEKHGHDDAHDHEHEGENHHGEDHHDEDDHGHEGEHGHHAFDAHLWLDPVNARAMVAEIAKVLAEADPAHADQYARNAESYSKLLDGLIAQTQAQLAGVRGVPFVVFHDAYQYMERRFGLSAVGSITVSPEVSPGAQRIAEIQEKLDQTEALCVFSEPQFPPRLVRVVTEGTDVRTGVLDPLGADIAAGPEMYFALIREMAGAFRDCLSPAG